ncbi:hypothetical protein ACFB49_05370 [Sphingomonas sp. DBB INV C78]|uniref:phospholipase D-like domain-containing protein n=1 Tax=Sphingomonas sp. DBB INV C78 TaxID=3349434 RepID=UPI0036D2CBA2
MPKPIAGGWVHFGGPDRPPRLLRDLLARRIEAVPEGGEIAWATYYFRDMALAEALMAASDRGVRVVLHVEGAPRRRSANDAVVTRLEKHGLNGGLNVHEPLLEALAPFHGHLHAKIYAFSHPEPTVLVGSFNPSGNDPEDPDVIAEIGDQDRGHNMLVEYRNPGLVATLRRHVLELDRPAPRFRPHENHVFEGAFASLYFYPRLRTGIIDKALHGLGSGTTIRGVISHLKPGFLSRGLAKAARAGAEVRLIVHDTERRVPEAIIDELAEAGVAIARYRHPQALPVHSKFLLIDRIGGRAAWFGSFNYNPRSRWLNREILLRSEDPALREALAERFDLIAGETAGFG